MAKSTTPKPATAPAAGTTNPELTATPPPNQQEPPAATPKANPSGEGEEPPAGASKIAGVADILLEAAPVATPLQILTAQIAGGICSGIIARRKPYDNLALDHEAIVSEADGIARHILATVQE